MTQNILSKTHQKIREKGPAGFLKWAFGATVHKQTPYILMERDVSLPSRKLRLPKDVRIERIESIDEASCKAHFAKDYPVYDRLLKDGNLAFGGFAGPDLVAACWWSPKDFYDEDVHHFLFETAPDQAYQFAGYVAKPYRNTAVSAEVLQTGWRYMEQQGMKRVYCAVALSNTPSLKLMLRSHFCETGQKLLTCRFLGSVRSHIETYDGELVGHLRRKRPAPAASSALDRSNVARPAT